MYPSRHVLHVDSDSNGEKTISDRSDSMRMPAVKPQDRQSMRPSKKPFFYSVKILALSTLAFGPDLLACDAIQQDNKRLVEQLNQQQALLKNLEQNVAQLEQSCQGAESTIAAQGAKAATAESCVTFKENAAMLNKLKQVSVSCASKVDVIHKQLDTLSRAYIAPEEKALESIVSLDQSLKSLQRHCGAQLRKTSEIQAHSNALLNASKAAVEKARRGLGNYTALAAKTKEFEITNKTYQAQCVGESNPPSENGRATASKGQGSVVIPRGEAPQHKSTITGKIKKDALPDP